MNEIKLKEEIYRIEKDSIFARSLYKKCMLLDDDLKNVLNKWLEKYEIESYYVYQYTVKEIMEIIGCDVISAIVIANSLKRLTEEEVNEKLEGIKEMEVISR